MQKVVLDVVDYFNQQNILPNGIELSEYKKKFMKSYPFLPDVIDCFYHRWGSFPTFQRTRGILRLLALILYHLKNRNLSYLSLADIDLKDSEIRRELLKHIGNEFDSVIAADITDNNSGSKKVDRSLGSSYKGLHLGTRTSTTIFLYSFSGGTEKGANINDIKRSASIVTIPSSAVSETVDLLKEKLFFVQYRAGRLFFTNQPNLNRIILNKMENVSDSEIIDLEKEYLNSSIRAGKLKTYLWIENSNDVPDDNNLKLIILKEHNIDLIQDILENKGKSRRINRNTLFFLVPTEAKRSELHNTLRKIIALENLQADISLQLSTEQQNDIQSTLKREKENAKMKIGEAYRTVVVPEKDKFDLLDLGVPTVGWGINLAEEVIEKLISEEIVADRMSPLILKEMYLEGKTHVQTKAIYENSLRTLGEDRFLNKTVLENTIIDGVEQGLFGLGELSNDKIVIAYWKTKPTVGFGDQEILIHKSICEREYAESKQEYISDAEPQVPFVAQEQSPQEQENVQEILSEQETLQEIQLPVINVKKGKVSDLLGLLRYLQHKFGKIEVIIHAKEGAITKEEFELKLKETLKQLGVEL